MLSAEAKMDCAYLDAIIGGQEMVLSAEKMFNKKKYLNSAGGTVDLNSDSIMFYMQ